MLLGALLFVVAQVAMALLIATLGPDPVPDFENSPGGYFMFSLLAGVVVGFPLSALAGTVDGLALAAIARSIYRGKLPALFSAALTALVSTIPVVIIVYYGLFGPGSDFGSVITYVMVPAASLWLALTWVGYYALRRTLIHLSPLPSQAG
jgi:hypothetical protein